MSMRNQARGRFRVSLRALMIAIALVALFLAPILWLNRAAERAVMLERLARDRAVLAARQARAQQQQALYVERIQAAQAALARDSKLKGSDGSIDLQGSAEPDAEIDRLKLENERLKRNVDQLEEALEKAKSPPSCSMAAPAHATTAARGFSTPTRSLRTASPKASRSRGYPIYDPERII